MSDACEYQIVYDEKPPLDAKNALFDGINKEAFTAKKMDPMQSFGLFIKAKNSSIFGGLTATMYYGCLYVDLLWIDPSLQRHGFGTKLMTEAEVIGRKRNCTFAAVNTMDWEALPFYQKLGYEIEFVRVGFEKESKLYMLRKSI